MRVATCALCDWMEGWTTQEAAEADAVWHVHREHPEVWAELIGSSRAPDVQRMPEDYGARLPLDKLIPTVGDDHRVGPEVPDRLFATAVLATLERIVAEEITEHGWDAPPVVGFLFQRERSPLAPDEWMHTVGLQWTPFPPSTPPLMAAERQYHVLVNVAYAFRALTPEGRDHVLPLGLVGVGLLTEGWMVLADPDSPPPSDGPSLSTHPDRIEVKTLHAVDLNGVRYAVNHPRGTEEPIGMAGLLQRGGYGAGGEVANSLHYLMEVLQGRTVPDYDDWSDAHGFELPE